jgi:YVTN family beta-propeller protein
MAKDPVERFHAAGDLATAARAALAGLDIAEGGVAGVGPVASHRARDEEYALVVEQKQRERIELSGRHELIEDDYWDDEVPADADRNAAVGHGAATETAIDVGDSPTVQHTHDAAGRAGEPPEAAAVQHAGVPASGARQGPNRVVLSVLAVVAVLVLVGAVLANPFRRDGEPAGDAGAGATTATPQAAPAAPAAPDVAASTGRPTVRSVLKVGQSPQGVAVSPDGTTIFVANVESRSLSMIDVVTPPLSLTIPMPGTPRYVAVSPDGRRAYVGMYTGDGGDSAVAVVDTAGKAVSTVVAGGPQPYALATSPNGDVFVPNHGASDVAILDGASLQFGTAVTVQPNPHGVAFAPSMNRAYTANHESSSVSVIDLASRAVVETVPVGRSPHSVAVSPDGRLVASANYADATVTLIDTATSEVRATVPAGNTPQHLTFASDGRHLYVVNEDADAISTIDPSTGATVSTTAVGRSPRYIVASPDGRTVYVSNADDGTVSVLEVSGP